MYDPTTIDRCESLTVGLLADGRYRLSFTPPGGRTVRWSSPAADMVLLINRVAHRRIAGFGYYHCAIAQLLFIEVSEPCKKS